MKTLLAEKVYSKEIAYTKDGQQRTFMKYSFNSGGQWYTLSGYGARNVQQGQSVSGIVSEKRFTKKDGSPGTELEFKLLSPVESDMMTRIEKLEDEYIKRFLPKQKAATETPSEPEPVEDDLPF